MFISTNYKAMNLITGQTFSIAGNIFFANVKDERSNSPPFEHIPTRPIPREASIEIFKLKQNFTYSISINQVLIGRPKKSVIHIYLALIH